MWLAIGQAVASGLVTLAGGYLGYRLAGRNDRANRRAEVLTQLDEDLRSLEEVAVRGVQGRPQLSAVEVLQAVRIKWESCDSWALAPAGSPATTLAMELEAELIAAGFDFSGPDPDFADDVDNLDVILGMIRHSRAECAMWRLDGPPAALALRSRRRRARQDLGRVQRLEGRQAAEAIGRIFDGH